MATLGELEKEINIIKERNRKVEKDKAWETSWPRRILILALTYLVASLFFYFAGLPEPLVNSIVPAMAFLLSTLTLDFFKKMWLERH